MQELKTLAELSHEFGTDDFVKGGGGNTSFKNTETLWIKPSGLALPEMTPDSFVPIDRAALAALYTTPAPDDSSEREALVGAMMAAAVASDKGQRASVETPLHDSFDAAYIVHTHPPLVTGMLCSQNAEAVCRKMFPNALWMGYTDPGYTLCMATRAELAAAVESTGRQPDVVFMQNHGLFVAADTAEGMRATHASVLDPLKRTYDALGISTRLDVGPAPSDERIAAARACFEAAMDDADEVHVDAAGWFAVPDGALSPDHIVYAKAHSLKGELSADAVRRFHATHGYWPRVVQTRDAVFGVGTSARAAHLALLLARDGARVLQLAEAFGGPAYMSEAACDFIDNWEVEAYRRKVAGT